MKPASAAIPANANSELACRVAKLAAEAMAEQIIAEELQREGVMKGQSS